MNIQFASRLVLLAGLASSMIGCAEWRTSKTLGQNIDDTTIVAEVKSKLATDKSIDSKNITVSSYKGTVQLSGFVNSESQLNKPAAIAGEVKGVRRVINNLVVAR